MAKTPIMYSINGKPNTGELLSREQDGFIPPNKYRANPKKFTRPEFTPERIKQIINSTQNSCLIAIERSTGTNIIKMDGSVARDLVDKCFEKKWTFHPIVPCYVFRLSDVNAGPGMPVEIKFYFYNNYYPRTTQEEERKAINFDVEQIGEAFRLFYVFETISISSGLIENILLNKPAFIHMDVEDLKTEIKGHFTLAP
jgi:hypothetical protein